MKKKLEPPISIGIIGCGHWGGNYIRLFHVIDGVQVAQVSDSSAEALLKVRRQYPHLRLIEEPAALIEDSGVQAVIIATPASTHYKLARQALLAGKHVLVEKPLALAVSEAEELVELARKAQTTLMVGHTFLYNPAVRKMKEYIQRGDLGKIYYLQATRTHLGLIRTDVSTVWDLAPHDVSIFSYLLGQQPQKVSAMGVGHLKKDVEDVAFINLLFDHDVIGNIHISWVDSNKLRQISVIGSKGRILFDDLNPLERLRFFEKGVSLDKPYESFGEFQLLLRDGDIISPKVEAEEPLRNVCLEFVQSIQTGKPPLADGLNGLRVVETMCAVHQSIAKQGEPVMIGSVLTAVDS